MNRLLKIMDRVISIILIVLVAFLAVGVSVTIILRYFLGISFSMLEELLTMSFIFITLFGSALAIREKQHISISYLMEKIVGSSRRKKVVATFLIDLSICFVTLVIVIFSIRWINQVGHLLSPNSHFPMKVYYFWVPVTFSLTFFYTVVDFLSLFFVFEKPFEGYLTDDVLPKEADK